MDEALDPARVRRLDDRARAVDVHGVDLGRGIERQGGRAVHHDARALQRALHGGAVADVARHDADAIALGIVEVGDVERRHGMPAGQQVPREVDPEEAGAAGDEIRRGLTHGVCDYTMRLGHVPAGGWREMDVSAVRILVDADAAALEAFLLRHADSSMFLRANARAWGLDDRGQPYQATYAAAFEDGQIAAVAAHTWMGMLLVQAPAHLDGVVRTAVAQSRRPGGGHQRPVVPRGGGALGARSRPRPPRS